jgi:[acyl-carrier-protein] S-malonyltransferase
MKGVLELAEVSDPGIPLVANVTADYEASAEEVKANLAAQVAGPVRWIETIELLSQDGYSTFIECGPGSVLAGLIKRIAPEAKTYSVSDTASLQSAREALLV